LISDASKIWKDEDVVRDDSFVLDIEIVEAFGVPYIVLTT
jgi:hypothetical protein